MAVDTAPRIDPVWYSAEAVQACADAWSDLQGRPTVTARAQRRRQTTRTWISTVLTLATVLPLMIWWRSASGLADVDLHPPWPWWSPSAIQFLGLALFIVGSVRQGTLGSNRWRQDPLRGPRPGLAATPGVRHRPA